MSDRIDLTAEAWDEDYNPFLQGDGDDEYVPGHAAPITQPHMEETTIPGGYDEPGEDDVVTTPVDADYMNAPTRVPDNGYGDHLWDDGSESVEYDDALDSDYDDPVNASLGTDGDEPVTDLGVSEYSAGSAPEALGAAGDLSASSGDGDLYVVADYVAVSADSDDGSDNMDVGDTGEGSVDGEDEDPFSPMDDEYPEYEDPYAGYDDEDYDDDYDDDPLDGVLDVIDGIGIEEEEAEEDPFKGFDIDAVIAQGIEMGASDVHIDPDKRIAYRVNGDIVRDEKFGPIPYDVTSRIFMDIVTKDNQTDYHEHWELDTSYELRSSRHAGRRTRLNVARTLGHNAMTFRIISDVIPTPEELNVDPRLIEWTKFGKGGIILGGITGSGKDLHEDTLIPGPNYPGGFIRLGDVQVGDIVYDENGNTCKVVGKHPGGSERFFHIKFRGLSETVLAGGNHLWVAEFPCDKYCRIILPKRSVAALLDMVVTAEDGERLPAHEITRRAGLAGDMADMVTGVLSRTFRDTGDGILVGKSCAHLLELHSQDSLMGRVDGPRTVTTQQMFEVCQRFGYNPIIRGLSGPVESSEPTDPTVTPVVLAATVTGLAEGQDGVRDVLAEAASWSVSDRLMLLGALLVQAPADSSDTTVSIPNDEHREGVARVARSLGMRATETMFDRLSITGVRDYLNDDFRGTCASTENIVEIEYMEEVHASQSEFWCLEVDSPSHLFLCTRDYVPTHNTTTFASLIRNLQKNSNQRIVTIEKPIEYIYPDDGITLLTPREVGSDTHSFSNALKAAMREDPDTILVGEVRDQEEVDEFLRAAESGHLTMTTIHSNTPAVTLNRIKSLYDGEDQRRILSTLQTNIRGLANQELLKTVDGKSRFALFSVLEITREVQEMIGAGDDHGIEDYMRDNDLTIERQIVNAVEQGRCTVEEGMRHAADLVYFKGLLGKDKITIA